MSLNALRMFIPITKVDIKQRLVYGVATGETVDRAGEVCDYATTKPYYEKWSGDIHKATDGKSLGNVRSMHGKVAAGKLTQINLNDDKKQIEICAKIVDDAEWEKVNEGVYTGFSQGGSYVKRWKDTEGVQRYTADPIEVSLVDLPCLPDSTFQVIKADGGGSELRKFVTIVKRPSNDEVAKRAGELAKAAGADDWSKFIEAATADLQKLPPVPEDAGTQPEPTEDAKAAAALAKANETPIDGSDWEQVWRSKRDGQAFKNKDDLRKHHRDLDAGEIKSPTLDTLAELNKLLGIEKPADATIVNKGAKDAAEETIKTAEDLAKAIAEATRDGRGALPLVEKQHITRRAVALGKAETLPAAWLFKAHGGELAKAAGLGTVSQLLNLLSQLECAEEALEGDGNANGYDYPYYNSKNTKINVSKEITNRFGKLLVEMGSMTAELLDAVLAEMGAEEAAEAMALAAPMGDLIKRGARHSAGDRIALQKAHDAIVAAGADCDPANKAAADADLAKLAGADGLAKIQEAFAKADARSEALQKALDGINPQLAEIMKRVKNIEAQPVPISSASLKVVSKGDDAGREAAGLLEKGMNDPKMREALALLAIQMAQSNPQARF